MSKLFNDLTEGQSLYIISKVNNKIIWFIETILSVAINDKFGIHSIDIETTNNFSFYDLPVMYNKYNINNQTIFTEKSDFIEELKHSINDSIYELHCTMSKLNEEIHSYEIALEKIKQL